MNNNDNIKKNKLTVEERDELLDLASQALIPRITDKAQSVRLAFTHAAASFFTRFNEEGVEIPQTDEDDPELRQGLQWALQHDPSVKNRVAALEALPMTVQTSDLFISRLRDVKSKVRETAAEMIGTLNAATQLDAEQCAAVIEAGSTSRCEVVKEKITDLICSGWMKTFEFDPIQLLKKISVVEHEDTCEKLVKILLTADKQHLSLLLNKSDFNRYWDELEAAGAGILTKKGEIDLTRLFYIRVRCQYLSQDSKQQEAQKEDLLTAILPDVPTLCEKFELHAMALMKVMVDQEQTIIAQNEEEMTCVCLNLLQLFEFVNLEEGSRVHLKATMKRMLESILTSDDLVDGCVKALRHVLGDREDLFWDEALEIVQFLDSAKVEAEADAKEVYILRILAAISVVCESSSTQLSHATDVQKKFYELVDPATSHENDMVREASVGCLGRLGMFATAHKFAEKYESIITEFARNELETMEIRVQALFALTDWVLISVPTAPGILDFLLQLVPELLQESEMKVVCAVAEVALRLLFSSKVVDSGWVAKLLVLFFDPKLSDHSSSDVIIEEDTGDTKSEIGSPDRLQQLLSLFFPAFCLQGENTRDTFVGSISQVLLLFLERDNQKRKRGTKTLPLTKVLDYVLTTANIPSDSRPADPEIITNPVDPTTVNSRATSSFLIAVQVAQFLEQKYDDCSNSLLRSLCKYLGSMELDFSSTDKNSRHISQLKELVVELGTHITDESCLEYMESLSETLASVEMIEPVNTETVSAENNDATNDLTVENATTTNDTETPEETSHDQMTIPNESEAGEDKENDENNNSNSNNNNLVSPFNSPASTKMSSPEAPDSEATRITRRRLTSPLRPSVV